MATAAPRLEAEGLAIRYPGAPSDAIGGIDLVIEPDRPLIVLGADGAGKSTLLAALAAVVPERMGGHASGLRRLRLRDGRQLELGPGGLRHDETASAWLERSALLLDDPTAQITGARGRVDEEVAMALECRGIPRTQMHAAVDRALETTGIAHLRARNPSTLSVGEAARVAFAALSVADPALFLFDEPTAHLDARGRRHVLEQIRALMASGETLVALATQDLDALDDVDAGGASDAVGRGDHDGGDAVRADDPRARDVLADRADFDVARFHTARALVLVEGRAVLTGAVADVFGSLDIDLHGVAPSTRGLVARVFEHGAVDSGLDQLAGLERGSAIEHFASRDPIPASTLFDAPVRSTKVVLEGVCATYADGTECLVGIDLTLRPGAISALIGANGAGKTSVARVIAGLLPVSSGRITFDDEDVTGRLAPGRSDRVGLVFQRPEDQLFERTVEREIAFGPRCRGVAGAELRAAVEWALELCDLGRYRREHPYDLTRAGRRWLGLASTLALHTPVVLLDEPTVGLDHSGTERLKHLLLDLRASGHSVLLISHDLDLVGDVADFVTVVDAGRVITAGPPSAVLAARARRSPAR